MLLQISFIVIFVVGIVIIGSVYPNLAALGLVVLLLLILGKR